MPPLHWGSLLPNLRDPPRALLTFPLGSSCKPNCTILFPLSQVLQSPDQTPTLPYVTDTPLKTNGFLFPQTPQIWFSVLFLLPELFLPTFKCSGLFFPSKPNEKKLCSEKPSPVSPNLNYSLLLNKFHNTLSSPFLTDVILCFIVVSICVCTQARLPPYLKASPYFIPTLLTQ